MDLFGKLNPEALCETYGTPLYIYDSSTIIERLEIFRAAFSNLPHRVLYAAKALSPVEILRLFRERGTGLDAVSLQEIELGLRAGFDARDILFTPSFPAEGDLERALDLGTRINIDSLGVLEKFASRHGAGASCCLRLKPPAPQEKNSEAAERWLRESKFGIAVEELDRAEAYVRNSGLRIEGLHVHSSSVILDTGVFLDAAAALFLAAERFPSIDYLDFGGGIKVPHREEDRVIDLAELARELEPIYRRFTQGYGREPELWFEPGRFLVSEAGLLLPAPQAPRAAGEKL